MEQHPPAPIITPIIATNTTVASIECTGFDDLTDKEKLYAYYFARASWEGAKICYFQRSYESPGLFYIFISIFATERPQELGYRLIMSETFKIEEIRKIYIYIAAFLQNCGNYKSFGDSKFIPELPKERFWTFLSNTHAYQKDKANFDKIWDLTNNEMYRFDQPYAIIEMNDKNGLNSYYSPSLSSKLIEKIDAQMLEKNISVLNTRVVKYSDDEIHVLVASGEREDTVDFCVVKEDDHTYQVKFVYGDFKPFLTSVYRNLELALSFTANDYQTEFLKDYVEHFKTGDMELHKKSQSKWIKDVGPTVETNIGFIETYLDPLKVRAEFEGFVSIQNKEESKLLQELVSNAPKVIERLPWPKEFEIQEFKKPDFTSLEIIAFACSGTPIGINIPNYDDIRQNEGFKNVNLGNVYGKPNSANVRFLGQKEEEAYLKYYKESLFIVVALHELIGHGSGKLFMQEKDGSFNFANDIKNPFTEEIVTSYYKHGENWHSRFGELSSGYEECKADSVALYLSTEEDIVKILLPKFSEDDRKKAVIAGWVDVIYGALKGLQYYSPEQKQWGQPHILASYVIFQVLRRNVPNMIKIIDSQREGQEYFTVEVDDSLIWTEGKKAIGDHLKRLQVYKSIGDHENGLKYFKNLAEVDEEMLKLRTITLLHKTPRKLELQPELVKENNKVRLVVFEESSEGIIESQVAHYQGKVDDVLLEFYKNQQYFKKK